MWQRMMSEDNWAVRGREVEGLVEDVGLGGQVVWEEDQGDSGAEDMEDGAWKQFLAIESDDVCLIDSLPAQGDERSAEDHGHCRNEEEGMPDHVVQSHIITECVQLAPKSDGFSGIIREGYAPGCSIEEKLPIHVVKTQGSMLCIELPESNGFLVAKEDHECVELSGSEGLLIAKEDHHSGCTTEEGMVSNAGDPVRTRDLIQLPSESDGFSAILKKSFDEGHIVEHEENCGEIQVMDEGNCMEIDMERSKLSKVVDPWSSVDEKEMNPSSSKDVSNRDEDSQIEHLEKAVEEKESMNIVKSGNHRRDELRNMEASDDNEEESSKSLNHEEDETKRSVRSQLDDGEEKRNSESFLGGSVAKMLSSDSEEDTSDDEDSSESSSNDEDEADPLVETQLQKTEKENPKTFLSHSVSNMLSPYLQYITDDDTSEDEADLSEGLAMVMTEDKTKKIAKKVHASKRNNEESSDEDENEIPRTKNEILVAHPVPKVEAVLEPHHKLVSLGSITSVIESIVIVEGHEIHQALNEGSILWLMEQKIPLGFVDEIFGPVKKPFYSVRYNSPEDVPKEAKPGASVAFVPAFSIMVHEDRELYKKGYDASGNNDEELPDDEWEFSDDEKESEFKRNRAAAKRQNFTEERDSANAFPHAYGKQCTQKASDNVPDKKQGEVFGKAPRSSPNSYARKKQTRFRNQTSPGSVALEGQHFKAQQPSPCRNDKMGSSYSGYGSSPSYAMNRSYNKNSQQSFSQVPSHPMGNEPLYSDSKSVAHPTRPSQCTSIQFTGPTMLEPHPGSGQLNAWNHQRPQPKPAFESSQGSEINSRHTGVQYRMNDIQAGHEQFSAVGGPSGSSHSVGPNKMPYFMPPFPGYPVGATQSQGRTMNEGARPPQFDVESNSFGGQHNSQYQQAIVSMATLGVHPNTCNTQPPIQFASNVQRNLMERPPLVPQMQLPVQQPRPPPFTATAEIMHPQLQQLQTHAFMSRPEYNQGTVSRGFHQPNSHAIQQVAQQQVYGGAVHQQGALPGPSSQWSTGMAFSRQTEFPRPNFNQPPLQGLHTIGIPVHGNAINMGNAPPQPMPSQSRYLGSIPTSNHFPTQVKGPRFSVHRPRQ